MNLPDPAPYATPAEQAFTRASKMVNEFGTTTAQASKALADFHAEYQRQRHTMNSPTPPDHRTPNWCQIIGGPLDGEMHADRGTVFRLAIEDGTHLDYQRYTLLEPVGEKQAAYIYAPWDWTADQINTALREKFPNLNRQRLIPQAHPAPTSPP